ncbi:MAG: hypothetical protein E6J91_22335 [Deltaproteobacteria bacterium]|nr:MAG: hypothetical protein E6J91_22335 [Deltaproteobacteria bacterium]
MMSHGGDLGGGLSGIDVRPRQRDREPYSQVRTVTCREFTRGDVDAGIAQKKQHIVGAVRGVEQDLRVWPVDE